MASKPLKQAVVEAIEPATMALPAMDRPSVALAWFMDTMVIESETDSDVKVMVCQACRAYVCEIENEDTLRVLFNTALAHGC